jgi:hypothetical protein
MVAGFLLQREPQMTTVPDYATEFYTIERTVELVANERTYRIEVLEQNKGAKRFVTRIYQQEDIVAQPAYPMSSNQYDRKPQIYSIWESIDVGWTDRDTADGALQQALGFLGERVKPR